MDFRGWDILLNLIVAALWFGAWGMDSRYAYFNSYLRPMYGRFEALFSILRPAFFGSPDRAIALALVAGVVLLRPLAVPRDLAWDLSIGAAPVAVGAAFPRGQLSLALLWSCLSTGIFLFALWSLCCPYLGLSRRPDGQVQTAIHALTAPFSWMHPAARPLFLAAFGFSLALLLGITGAGSDGTAPRWAAALLAVFSAWVALLDILRSLVLALIVGQWIGLATGAEGMRWMCAEWIDHLLGPLRNYPLRIGMFDLTPLIFFIGLGVAQHLLMRMLVAAGGLLP